jgi:hypothetical protein
MHHQSLPPQSAVVMRCPAPTGDTPASLAHPTPTRPAVPSAFAALVGGRRCLACSCCAVCLLRRVDALIVRIRRCAAFHCAQGWRGCAAGPSSSRCRCCSWFPEGSGCWGAWGRRSRLLPVAAATTSTRSAPIGAPIPAAAIATPITGPPRGAGLPIAAVVSTLVAVGERLAGGTPTITHPLESAGGGAACAGRASRLGSIHTGEPWRGGGLADGPTWTLAAVGWLPCMQTWPCKGCPRQGLGSEGFRKHTHCTYIT